MPDRYVCIHGHFYQPPRENPWLEAVEMQESAFPKHDWNERITDECYGPNASARIQDDQGWTTELSNDYSRISFNMGPTLLAWLEAHAPIVYGQIQNADRESMERFGGHGSAMAQAYNHMIMPLSNDRDRRTQVVWGVRDFERRFGRKPKGMWLPETAADTPSLEALAEQGIEFTVLAPRQAARVRPIDGGEWKDCNGGVDPSTAYLCRLPSGKTMTLFFYDGPISQGVAFEGLLHSSDRFAGRLLDGFDDSRPWPQLAHIATDGESYGHHHRHGEMALAAALAQIEARDGIRLTNYAEFMNLHPPIHEAQIIEASSWSCVHGVGRWKEDCGCNSGGHGDWNQAWRGPLRNALDWLRDAAAPRFESAAGELLRDPWAARDAYIDVILDRSPGTVRAYFEAHQVRPLTGPEQTRVLKLMELQRHAMLMYTSCGWFFDEISGIEASQVIQYAGRVIQLAGDVLAADFEEEFLSRLEQAKSNIRARGNGRKVYIDVVKPAIVDLVRVGAHYAVTSLFEDFPEAASVYCYDVTRNALTTRTAGRAKLSVGRATVTSRITLESEELSFGVLHLGDHTLNCGVRKFQGAEQYDKLVRDTHAGFERADFAQVIRDMDHAFGVANYSIASLFRDEQHKVVRHILAPALEQVDLMFRQIHEQHAPLVRSLRQLNLYVPRRLLAPAAFVVNQGLRDAMSSEPIDFRRIEMLLDEARHEGVQLDGQLLGYTLSETLERLIERIGPETPADELGRVQQIVKLAQDLPFDVDVWRVHDMFFRLMKSIRPPAVERAGAGESDSEQWVAAFDDLGAMLRIRVS